MLKNVETQKGDLMKIKDDFDARFVELSERLKKINADKETLKEECHELQKQLSPSA